MENDLERLGCERRHSGRRKTFGSKDDILVEERHGARRNLRGKRDIQEGNITDNMGRKRYSIMSKKGVKRW